MDFIEVEGKTYEEAIRKASAQLNVEEKDLDIEVKEVDTKGILGLLGSKKVRITARIKEKDMPVEKKAPEENDEPEENNVPVEMNVSASDDTPEGYGYKFLEGLGQFIGLAFNIKVNQMHERFMFLIQCDNGDVLIGKDGETLEALQHLLRLAIAKRFKEGQKVLVDINGYREKRRKALTIMAKRLGDKVKRTGRRLKTDPLNPYERRIVHTLFKNNKNVMTKSEGEGHTKKVVISPTGTMNGRR
jgi:spoIIIJ-associated protein